MNSGIDYTNLINGLIPIALAVLAALASILSRAVKNAIETHSSSAIIQIVSELARVGVEAAEQQFSDNEYKRGYVEEFVRAMIAAMNINVDESTLDILLDSALESSVLSLKKK